MKTSIFFLFYAVPVISLMLDCDFVYHDWKHLENYYTCSAKNLDVLQPNLRFLSMEGTHLFNKSNSDVLGILFENQRMSYIVQGASSFFSRMEIFHVAHSQLIYIQRNDFRHTRNLKTLTLCHNNIERVAQDTFTDLTKLEYLSLAFNKIKSLPSYVFGTLHDLKGLYLDNNLLEEFVHLLLKHNGKITELWLQKNQLKSISSNMSEPLRNLTNVYLSDNICINKDFKNLNATNFILLKKEIEENCSSQCESKMIEVAECSEKYFELEMENENLNNEITSLRKYLRSKLII